MTKLEYKVNLKKLQSKLTALKRSGLEIERRQVEVDSLQSLDDMIALAKSVRRRLEAEGIQP